MEFVFRRTEAPGTPGRRGSRGRRWLPGAGHAALRGARANRTGTDRAGRAGTGRARAVAARRRTDRGRARRGRRARRSARTPSRDRPGGDASRGHQVRQPGRVRSSALTTRSPRRSRSADQSVSRSSNGVHCATTLITWVPFGPRVGSERRDRRLQVGLVPDPHVLRGVERPARDDRSRARSRPACQVLGSAPSNDRRPGSARSTFETDQGSVCSSRASADAADLDRIQERRERAFRVDRGDHRAPRSRSRRRAARRSRRWRSTETSATWDEVRISAPNPRAASASASASAPGPPRTIVDCPAPRRRCRPSPRAARPSCPPTTGPSPCTGRPGSDARLASRRFRTSPPRSRRSPSVARASPPPRLLPEPTERVPGLHAVQRVGERRVLHVRWVIACR